MPKSGSELLFLGLIIAGFLLFNYVARQLAQKAREQPEAADASAPPAGDEPLENLWGRAPAPLPAGPEPIARAVPLPYAGPPQPSRRRTRARLFRTRRDLRRAVVAMTVLGPCRALEPHERR